ncbi:alpha/beta hydrolase [Phenylobacterium aquaticum]|uniref:alpha/beta hydrolase n=1 Tax=Phenylobacterium aquaticum TaxID=1763816 RepID=UPI001F5CA17E|nr:alpha/beta hydrolase [Phenylobacterium aquaticum]MCI3132278.1 alpha/beta hydrolase [Phenylobacterium aquaticum]
MDKRTNGRGGLKAMAEAVSPLGLFAALTPKDPARRSGRAIAFGPHARLKLDVYAPVRASGPAPVAIFFYGGAWETGRRQDYGWAARAFAAKGFLTLAPDYRLHPEVVYPEFLKDGAAAVRWAVDHAAAHGGDPDRIVLAGHSAGAYIAMMLGLDGRYLSEAGVDPGRIRALAGLSGPYEFQPPYQNPTIIRTFGAAADPAATQPAAHVTASSPPAFLGHGDSDKLVGRRNMRTLAAAYREKGVLVEDRVYPGMDHSGMVLALSRPFRGRAPVLEEMTGFLKAQAG